GGVAFDALPLRSVEAAAGLLPGVRRDFADGSLSVRARSGVVPDGAGPFSHAARLGQAPVYVVDGVRLLGGPLVPFPAVAAVAVMTDFAPAAYGDAAGGLVLVETRGGGERLRAEVEALTSEGLDAFGHSVAAFTAGGPLGGGR